MGRLIENVAPNIQSSSWWIFSLIEKEQMTFLGDGPDVGLRRRPLVCASVCASIFPSANTFNINFSETLWSFTIKFKLKHPWVNGRAALRLSKHWINPLVFMATHSSHRVTCIMKKIVSLRFTWCDQNRIILRGHDDVQSLDVEIRPDPTMDYWDNCSWAPDENPIYLYMYTYVHSPKR